MKSLTLKAGPVTLRSIGPEDLEDLRRWKNDNRRAFFFKDVITPEGQKKWYEGYLGRPDDFMFVVEAEGMKVGCMGFRKIEGAADCYNIIGAPEGRGKGYLGAAMEAMCGHIEESLGTVPITCKVLKTNPAVTWYEKRGFKIAADKGDHWIMELA